MKNKIGPSSSRNRRITRESDKAIKAEEKREARLARSQGPVPNHEGTVTPQVYEVSKGLSDLEIADRVSRGIPLSGERRENPNPSRRSRGAERNG